MYPSPAGYPCADTVGVLIAIATRHAVAMRRMTRTAELGWNAIRNAACFDKSIGTLLLTCLRTFPTSAHGKALSRRALPSSWAVRRGRQLEIDCLATPDPRLRVSDSSTKKSEQSVRRRAIARRAGMDFSE